MFDMTKYRALLRADRAGQRAFKAGTHDEHSGEEIRAFAAKRYNGCTDMVRAYMAGFYGALRQAEMPVYDT
jgi:hypothetical protein